MRITYQGLIMEIPVDGLLQVEDFTLQATFNEHARVRIKCLLDEDSVKNFVWNISENEQVMVWGTGEEMLFCGRILYVQTALESALHYLYLDGISYTYDWSLEEVSQSFCDLDTSYQTVMNQVLENHEGAAILDCVTEGGIIPDFMLQYEESDWTFLKRLASQFGTFVIPEFTTPYGRAYFGIPDIDRQTELSFEDYLVNKDMGKYYRLLGKYEVFPQEMISWSIRSERDLKLGETVLLNQVKAVITHIDYDVVNGSLIKNYLAARRRGMRCPRKNNPRIYGMSIPATVKERSGNCIRVHFDIDKEYTWGAKVKYFTYAIESSSIYCIPEKGSRVHIYFPTHDEKDAIAVHAIRTVGKNQSGNYAQNPAYKSFSNIDGAEVLLAPAGIAAVGNKAKTVYVEMTDDGEINLSGQTIWISSEDKMMLGKSEEGEEAPVTRIEMYGGTGIWLQLGEDESNSIVLTAEAKIIADTVNLDVPPIESTDADGNVILDGSAEMIVDAADMEAEGEDGAEGKKEVQPLMAKQVEAMAEVDAATRSAITESVVQELRDKRDNGKKQAGIGSVEVGVTAIATRLALKAAAGAPGIIIGLAITAASFGGSEMYEGMCDYTKGMSGDLSDSFNPLRDTIFGGHQGLYDLGRMVAQVAFGAVTGKAIFGANSALANQTFQVCRIKMDAKMAAQIGIKIIPGMVKSYIQDGKVNIGSFALEMSLGILQSYLGTAISHSALRYLQIDDFFLARVGMGTTVDVMMDLLFSLFTEKEFNALESVIQNGLVNFIAEYGGDPVEVVSGSYLYSATDMVYANVDEPVELKRQYLSTVKDTGSFGRGWSFTYDSRMYKQGEAVHLKTITGHRMIFTQADGTWVCGSKGCSGFLLEQDDINRRFLLRDIKKHTTCYYDEFGFLTMIADKNHQKTHFTYEDGMLKCMTLPLGNQIDFVCQDGRIRQISDQLGRTIQYRYEGDLLTDVIHVDEGAIHYDYDENGYLTRMTNQDGQVHLVNTYDKEGRVIHQQFQNGEMYEISYDAEKRRNTFYYSGLNRTTIYSYNRDSIVTGIEYDDGSKVLYEYDDENWRTKKQDRKGNRQYWEYDSYGRMIKEIQADGYEKEYIYDENRDLVRETDNGGRETRYEYDGCHNQVKVSKRIDQHQWQVECFTYDRMGRLLSETDARNQVTNYQYEKNGSKPKCVTNARGEQVFYEYDIVGWRTAIENSYGRVELGYNSKNYITSRKDGEGNTSQYLYNRMGKLITYYPAKAWKEQSNPYRYNYNFMSKRIEVVTPLDEHYLSARNGEGDVLKTIHPESFQWGAKDGVGVSYEYDRDHHCIRKHHPDGGTERFFYDAEGNLIKHVMPEYYDAEADDGIGNTYEYDTQNRLVKIYNPDGEVVKEFAYDFYGNVTEEKDGTGHHCYYAYNGLNKVTEKWESVGQREGITVYRVILYSYDLQGNKIKERYGQEEVGYQSYPQAYHELNFAYDESNRLILVKDGYGAAMEYRYDCLNNKTFEERIISDGIYQRIYYDYNKNGWLVQKREEIMGNGEVNQAVTEYAYDENGNIIREKTPNGHLLLRTYDGCDRLTEERTIDKQNQIDRVVSFTYDKAGNILTVQESGEGTEASVVSYRYDWKNRMVQKVNELGGVEQYLYDKNDRLKKQVQPGGYQGEHQEGIGTEYQYDNQGNLVQVRNGLGEVTLRNRYNAAKQLISQVDASGNQMDVEYTDDFQPKAVSSNRSRTEGKAVQQYQYNARGQIVGIVDGNENKTGYEVDGWGRIVKIKGADGSEEGYGYNYGGGITETTDGNGNQIQYRYNSFGKVCEIVDQEGEKETFVYDGEQNLILRIDRNENRVERTYTVDGKLAREVAVDKEGKNRITSTYAYDKRGRLIKAVNQGFCYEYEYTKAGQLAAKRENGRQLLGYTYYSDGKIESLTDVSGKTAYYRYDGLGRLSDIQDDYDKVIVSYQYQKDDRLAVVTHGNGISTCYEYDSDGNISRLAIRSETEIFFDCQYQYDGNGNRVLKEGSMLGVTGENESVFNAYSYDRKNRLIEERCEKDWCCYRYDGAGNRIQKETENHVDSYRYNNKNQLVEHEGTAGSTSFTYNLQGGMISKEGYAGITNYTYNPLNQQVEGFSSEKGVQRNYYDPEGLRAGLEENGQYSQFVFHQREILTEEDGNLALSARFIRGYGVESCQQNGQSYYYQKDEQFSTLLMTGQEREVENLYQYDAFGVVRGSQEQVRNRITYVGQQYDGVTEQYYLRARYYNPVLGRFLQEDEYRGDGLNLYAYCGNNPVGYYDFSGYTGQSVDSKNLCLNPEDSKAEDGETEHLYRQMSEAEAEATIREQELQYAIEGAEPTKWMTESEKKALEFKNLLNDGKDMMVLDFEISKEYSNYLHETSVKQRGSKKNPNNKYHYEGLQKPSIYKNFGILETNIVEFNNNLIRVTIYDGNDR